MSQPIADALASLYALFNHEVSLIGVYYDHVELLGYGWNTMMRCVCVMDVILVVGSIFMFNGNPQQKGGKKINFEFSL